MANDEADFTLPSPEESSEDEDDVGEEEEEEEDSKPAAVESPAWSLAQMDSKDDSLLAETSMEKMARQAAASLQVEDDRKKRTLSEALGEHYELEDRALNRTNAPPLKRFKGGPQDMLTALKLGAYTAKAQAEAKAKEKKKKPAAKKKEAKEAKVGVDYWLHGATMKRAPEKQGPKVDRSRSNSPASSVGSEDSFQQKLAAAKAASLKNMKKHAAAATGDSDPDDCEFIGSVPASKRSKKSDKKKSCEEDPQLVMTKLVTQSTADISKVVENSNEALQESLLFKVADSTESIKVAVRDWCTIANNYVLKELKEHKSSLDTTECHLAKLAENTAECQLATLKKSDKAVAEVGDAVSSLGEAVTDIGKNVGRIGLGVMTLTKAVNNVTSIGKAVGNLMTKVDDIGKAQTFVNIKLDRILKLLGQEVSSPYQGSSNTNSHDSPDGNSGSGGSGESRTPASGSGSGSGVGNSGNVPGSAFGSAGSAPNGGVQDAAALLCSFAGTQKSPQEPSNDAESAYNSLTFPTTQEMIEAVSVTLDQNGKDFVDRTAAVTPAVSRGKKNYGLPRTKRPPKGTVLHREVPHDPLFNSMSDIQY